MDNATIADMFDEMAELLELRGENQFRVRAYRNGAKTIRELTVQVADILADPEQDLRKHSGIGDTLADKCKVMVESGKLPQLEELRANTPAVLVKMTRIPGVGAKESDGDAKRAWESIRSTNSGKRVSTIAFEL